MKTSRLLVCGLSALALGGASIDMACSSFDASGSDGAPDAAATPDGFVPTPTIDAGPMPDASPPRACDPTKPFGEPTLVPGDVHSNRNDDGFWMLPSGLTAYFSSDRPDVPDGGVGSHIFSATRPNPTAAWGSSAPELAIDDAGPARAPVLSPDGRTLYFFRGAGGPGEILTSTRSSDTEAFGAPIAAGAPFTEGTTNAVTWIAADGNSIVFSSNRLGKLDIYRTRFDGGAWTTPEALASLDSVKNDYAVLTPDELQAFVASDRIGDGGLDLYYTRRASTSDPFPPPVALEGVNLNTPQSEIVTYVSADGCTLYFKRATAPFGLYQIYVAVRPQ